MRSSLRDSALFVSPALGRTAIPSLHASNENAGHSIERLATLSDGIFAWPRPLPLFEWHVPAHAAITSEGALGHALVTLSPQLLGYLMSFMTRWIFWVGQQTQLNHLTRSDRLLSWIHLAFFFAITLMSFSTRLQAEFVTSRTALLAYWLYIFLLGNLLFASWRRAKGSGINTHDLAEATEAAICRRILIPRSLYAISAVL